MSQETQIEKTKHVDLKESTVEALGRARDDLEFASIDETVRYFIRAQETRRGKSWLAKKEAEKDE